MTDHKDHSGAGIQKNGVVAVLQRAWATWKRIGQAVMDFASRVVLSLFYFSVFVPFAVGVRLFGDPLEVKRRAGSSQWIERATRDLALADVRRQF